MTPDEDKIESSSSGGSNEGCIACNSLALEPTWNSDCYSDSEYGLHRECTLPVCVGYNKNKWCIVKRERTTKTEYKNVLFFYVKIW